MGFGLGSFGSKLKSVNVNSIINLGFSLFGLQLGRGAANQAILSITNNGQTQLGPLSAANMIALVDVGVDITMAAVLTKFVKKLPYGNLAAPVIAITTAASVIPRVLNVVLNLSGTTTSTSAPAFTGPSFVSGDGGVSGSGEPSAPFLPVRQPGGMPLVPGIPQWNQ